MRKFLMIALLGLAGAAHASSPVGRWHTIDDKTGEVKSLVTIEDKGGVLSGRVTELLRKGADPAARCDKCVDDRKGQTILGMEIIRGVKKSAGNDYWDSGEILVNSQLASSNERIWAAGDVTGHREHLETR